MGSKSWFLVHSKPSQEDTAAVNLTRQGYEVYLPRARVRRRLHGRMTERVQPLFPRYLFVELDAHTDDWAPIRSTLGVSRLVRFGEYPASVPGSLIELLKSRESEGVHDWSVPALHAGQKVRVLEGAFRDFEGIFVAQTSRERVIVLLEILGRAVRASLQEGQYEAVIT